MPITVEIDGKPTVVHTADELAAHAAAEVARVNEAAAKEREAAIANAKLEAAAALDVHGKTAAARREAEKKAADIQQDADARVAAAQAELEAAQAGHTQTAAQLTALQAELDTAKAEREKATTESEGIKADFARKTALIEAGARPGQVARVEALLQADGIELSDAAAVQQALETLKADVPGLFLDGKAGSYTPAGAAKNPPPNAGPQTVADIEAMTPREYEKWRKENFRS